MKKTVLALVTVSMLVLSGCGGGGGSSEDEKVADNIAKYMSSQEEGESMVAMNEEDSKCVGDGMVDDIGVDELKKYGFLKEDGTVAKDAQVEMSTEDAEAMSNTMFDCTDVMAMINDAMSEQLQGQDPAVKKCIDEALTEERVKGMLVAGFSGKEQEAQKELTEPLMKCATDAMGG